MNNFFSNFRAASYRGKTSSFKGIKNIDLINISDLLFLDDKFDILKNNINDFLNNKSYQHCLLSGAKGCGKTSLVKAVFNDFINTKLRIVEIFKDDLKDLRYIIDDLENLNFYFILFLDDLSFNVNDDDYKLLKPIIDGGIENLSNNIMFIVSSNYKNVLKNNNKNYQDADFNDEMDDKFSLKERFGIWLNFYALNQEQYLKIVKSYFKNYENDERLFKEAIEFSNLRASRNGRIAKQFCEIFKDKI